MAVDWGAMVSDASTQTEAGVPIDIWNTWSDQTQEMYLQDYFRTDDQKNYVDIWAENPLNPLAYVYTGYVDLALGTDAAQSADVGLVDDIQEAGYGSPEDSYETIKETAADVVDFTKDAATIAVIAGAFLLLRK